MAGIETVGAQYLVLDNSHRPEEEQGEGHDVNGHYQQQDSSPVARNTSCQPLQDIEASGTEIHPVHSSEYFAILSL